MNLLLLIATWVSTGLILHLLVGFDKLQDPSMILTVATIFFAEALCLSDGIVRWASSFGSSTTEVDSGTRMLHWFYGVEVAALAAVAFGLKIAFKWLATLHILAALSLLFGWATMARARNHLAAMDKSQARDETS